MIMYRVSRKSKRIEYKKPNSSIKDKKNKRINITNEYMVPVKNIGTYQAIGVYSNLLKYYSSKYYYFKNKKDYILWKLKYGL